jgi:hypothetical protein
MVTLYVGGKAVRWEDAEELFARAARTEPVELRDAAGRVIATTAPAAEGDPEWVQAITPEETARRLAGPFFTLDECCTRGGRP